MRVLIATDAIGSLPSLQAGELLAVGWPDAEVTVVPVGEAGSGFLSCAADQLGLQVESGALDEGFVGVARGSGVVVVAVEGAGQPPGGIPYAASSAFLGQAVEQALAASDAPVKRLVVDLAGLPVHDAGAGFLSALGARSRGPSGAVLDGGVAGLGSVTEVDLTAVRERLRHVDLIGVVPSSEATALLLGLRGITSMRARGREEDRRLLLDTDAALASFAQLVDPVASTTPGAGARGGLGFAVLALGGRLLTGQQFAFDHEAVRRQLSGTDLVVTGCTVFDFARRGGGVVAFAAELAASLLCPCVAVAATVLIGGRELRTMGIESAYAVTDVRLPGGDEDVDEEELLATARRVGRSWRW